MRQLAAQEKIDSATQGSSAFATPDWRGDVQDDFETYGAGVRAQLTRRRSRLDLDYTHAEGDSRHAHRGRRRRHRSRP
ncbi:MAG: MtrB/PioB family outer membrane beta-barrel protein [Chromatiales bacterium]|nr:MtrB/PioB family outer membrane beta-barrel protein [Chromatiales bacterium]